MRDLKFLLLLIKTFFWAWMCWALKLSKKMFNFCTKNVFNFCIKKLILSYGLVIGDYRDLLFKYISEKRIERLANSMDMVLDYYCTNVLGLGKENCDGNH